MIIRQRVLDGILLLSCCGGIIHGLRAEENHVTILSETEESAPQDNGGDSSAPDATKQALQLLEPSQLTLTSRARELDDLLDQIHRQTGNRLRDYRAQFGQETRPLDLTLELNNEPFWPGLDQVLDRAQLSLYPYSGEDSLAVIEREAGTTPRSGRACYAGSFRIEAVKMVSQRDLRFASQQKQTGSIELEIAWEPRLRPLGMTLPVELLRILADDKTPVQLGDARQTFAVEVQPGSHATELHIPFELPPRKVTKLASLQGLLLALVPGKTIEFHFQDLSSKKAQRQERGGVSVELRELRKNQQLWEVHMRLRVDSEELTLQSHRGWVLQNLTYLLDKQGKIINHVGLETIMQRAREIELAYFFDLPDDQIQNCTWVYHTPAAILQMPVPFELHDILLP